MDTSGPMLPGYAFKTGYPTENAEPLLQRIIEDNYKGGRFNSRLFNGSGTTVAVAEKNGKENGLELI